MDIIEEENEDLAKVKELEKKMELLGIKRDNSSFVRGRYSHLLCPKVSVYMLPHVLLPSL